MAKGNMRPGGGGRFAKLKGQIEKEGKSPAAAGAIAGSIGRKKYGSAQMGEWSASGRKRGK